MTKLIPAKDLKKGDVLANTGETVLVEPYSTLKTPPWKVNIRVGHSEDRGRVATWGKETLISIIV